MSLPLHRQYRLWSNKNDGTPVSDEEYKENLIVIPKKGYPAISTIQDWWQCWNNTVELWDPIKHGKHHQFFLMKEGVTPCWGDKENSHVERWTILVPAKEGKDTFLKLCLRVIGEQFEHFEPNGVGIGYRVPFHGSPQVCSLQIWWERKIDPDTEHTILNSALIDLTNTKPLSILIKRH